MAEIKGHGVPGGHIEGAVGDIYVDERTGLKYINVHTQEDLTVS